MAGEITQAYNTDSAIPLISYNCTSYLMKNNELVWKLLKYPNSDAWDETNLTVAEKRAMIYNGGLDQYDYHVFFDDFQDDSMDKETTFLRIFPLEDTPESNSISNVAIAMAVYTHSNLNHLSNYQTRVETIIQQLKETFNGATVPKVGTLVYNQKRNRLCKSMLIGKVPYKGKVVIFQTFSSSIDSGC